MSSKFSNDVANGMNTILKDSSFQRIFSKTASVKTAGEEIFDIKELASRFPDAYNALLEPDKLKFQNYLFHVNSANHIVAKANDGTDEYLFMHDHDRAPTWMKTADNTAEVAFNAFASKKKKSEDEDEKEEKSEKSDKKKDKKDDKDSDKEEKSDKKKDKDGDKDGDKDEDKDDKKSKKSKKDDKDEDDKDDEKKDKKKSFPFFKKKKAGSCAEDCECEDCVDSNKMYASALKHIVESFTVTSDVLDNMGLEKSAVATMAILDHIINEAATIKFAKESEEVMLKDKLEKLKEKFKKMHDKDATDYDDKAAEELDEKITKLEDKIKDLKKKDLKTDENDVRGTDLLLGLEDQEAREGFNDPEMDDPKSSAVLEEILSKNPKLVDDVVPGLKSQFGDRDIEEQLRSRIKSRLPEVVHETPENTNIDALLDAYQEARNIPPSAKLPHEERATIPSKPKHDPLKTRIDELNADDMDDDQLVKIMVKKLQYNFEDYNDHGEVDCTKLSEDIANEFDLYEDDDGKIPERVFEAATEAAEVYENLKDNDEGSEELNFADDMVRAYALIDEWTKTAHEDDHDEISVGDVESILDIMGNYSQDEIAEKEKSFKHPDKLKELSDEFYDAAMKNDKNSSDDEDFGLEKLQKEHPEAYEALPEPYKNDSALVFFIDKNGNLCAEGDFGTENLEEFTWLTDTKEWIAIK